MVTRGLFMGLLFLRQATVTGTTMARKEEKCHRARPSEAPGRSVGENVRSPPRDTEGLRRDRLDRALDLLVRKRIFADCARVLVQAPVQALARALVHAPVDPSGLLGDALPRHVVDIRGDGRGLAV